MYCAAKLKRYRGLDLSKSCKIKIYGSFAQPGKKGLCAKTYILVLLNNPTVHSGEVTGGRFEINEAKPSCFKGSNLLDYDKLSTNNQLNLM